MVETWDVSLLLFGHWLSIGSTAAYGGGALPAESLPEYLVDLNPWVLIYQS
jgi:hypothetical protein